MNVGTVTARCIRCQEEMRVPINRKMSYKQLFNWTKAYLCPMCRKTVSRSVLEEMHWAGLK